MIRKGVSQPFDLKGNALRLAFKSAVLSYKNMSSIEMQKRKRPNKRQRQMKRRRPVEMIPLLEALSMAAHAMSVTTEKSGALGLLSPRRPPQSA